MATEGEEFVGAVVAGDGGDEFAGFAAQGVGREVVVVDAEFEADLFDVVL